MSVQVIIPFTTDDYPKWKEIFDEYSRARVGWGAEGYVIYRGVDQPNAVIVTHYFADRDGAQRFVEDPSIRAAVRHWNEEELPEMHIYEEVDRLF